MTLIGVGMGTDLSTLAADHDVDPDLLQCALDDAAELMRLSKQYARPANKKALRGMAEALGPIVERLSDPAVQERLAAAGAQVPDGSDQDDLAHYAAWYSALPRVDRAVAGVTDLLDLVRAGDAVTMPPGRPANMHHAATTISLVRFWSHRLGRDVTISGHGDDGRNIKPSPALRFIHDCVTWLNEPVTMQECRTILKNLKKQNFELGGNCW